MVSVKVGTIVTLQDYVMDEVVTLEIVDQTKRVHYVGRNFDSDEYEIKSVYVLESGGNGFTSISLESKLGKALCGHVVGDVVEYKNDFGDDEKFKILDIKY
ncbi:GreA/GreB family elongation factor [Pseudobutyrivibrio xylanivorans]|uniref:Transcription elongation factor GreA/GreB C-terminal domain-containing protein n=1 Tax=Pseudobutyrivibrio xylanivorans TaxID=185007 RepID=A0A5P6VVY4_PSEXY|nr:GreA/GreB family elongation factor [Pseudobutyrivibrio xylanivorans]QFJ56004.1 hypothetical protein FXF36_14440 [Pseudobutyrivibrio xylanivorans]